MDNEIGDPSTPIINAINESVESDVAKILYLIEQKSSNVNEVDTEERRTPLHFAVLRSSLIVQRLLECGAELSLKDIYGCTPLHIAGDAMCSLVHSGKKGIYDIYKILLDNGADCNELDDEYTPLHCALRFQSVEIIKLLLNYGADMKVVSKFGRTAIHLAAENPDVEVIEFILDQGFDIGCRDPEGYSPLHYAAKRSNFNVCKLLLSRGAVADSRSKNGLTPLDNVLSTPHHCEETDRRKTIEILQEFGGKETYQIPCKQKRGDRTELGMRIALH